jgi:hypothetical protein
MLEGLESKQLIFELLSTDDFSSRSHRYSSGTIYALAYSKRLERGDEHEAEEIAQIMDGFLSAARVRTWVVGALPFLNHLLAYWKRYGDKLQNFEAECMRGT